MVLLSSLLPFSLSLIFPDRTFLLHHCPSPFPSPYSSHYGIGSLVVGGDSSIGISSGSEPIQVTNCVALNGTLDINVTGTSTSQMTVLTSLHLLPPSSISLPLLPPPFTSSTSPLSLSPLPLLNSQNSLRWSLLHPLLFSLI